LIGSKAFLPKQIAFDYVVPFLKTDKIFMFRIDAD